MRLLEFGANWCGTCRAMKPVIARVKESFKLNSEYIDLETSSGQEFANVANVQSLPTYIVIDNDTKPLRSLSEADFIGCRVVRGTMSEDKLIKALKLK